MGAKGYRVRASVTKNIRCKGVSCEGICDKEYQVSCRRERTPQAVDRPGPFASISHKSSVAQRTVIKSYVLIVIRVAYLLLMKSSTVTRNRQPQYVDTLQKGIDQFEIAIKKQMTQTQLNTFWAHQRKHAVTLSQGDFGSQSDNSQRPPVSPGLLKG